MSLKIKGVRFTEAIHVGKALDIQSYVEQGMSILGDKITLSKYDDTFLSIRFNSGYRQLVPFSTVATIFIDEPAAVDDLTSKRSKG